MNVIFYKNSKDGQEEVGRIGFDGNDLKITPDNLMMKQCLSTLLSGIEYTRDNVQKALSQASRIFDGMYFTAKVEK